MDKKCSLTPYTDIGFGTAVADRTLRNIDNIQTCMLACNLDEMCDKAFYTRDRMCYLFKAGPMDTVESEGSIMFTKTCDRCEYCCKMGHFM